MPTPPTKPATPAPPLNRPQGAAEPPTVGPAQTYPPGSRYQERMERDSDGPDPQEAKLRPYELARAQDEPVLTAAQEQRQRSEEMAEEGVERRKARLDERDPRDRPRTVAGVRPTQVDADAPNRH
jgi:hypothetical protein